VQAGRFNSSELLSRKENLRLVLAHRTLIARGVSF